MRKVVVTGMGAVTPLGIGVKPLWTGLLAGKSGLSTLDLPDSDDLTSRVVGAVPPPPEGLDPLQVVSVKDQKKIDRFILLALAAAHEAVTHANWMPEREEDLNTTGVMIGSGIGGLNNIAKGSLLIEDKPARRLSPFFIPSALVNLASGHVSLRYGFRGPNHAPSTACATGTHAIGDAARLISTGDADVMIAGGTEAAICRLGMAGFMVARALSTGYNDSPAEASRPFDEGRDGFIMSEGAGVLVLEAEDHAKKRGTPILAYVAGYGLSGDAHHITAPPPDGHGGLRAMRRALERADVRIDYLNAHATSTPVGDEVELHAIKGLWGDDAREIAISSTKSALGHMLGAAGAVEAIIAIQTLHMHAIPPTLNLHNPCDAGKGLNLVPLRAQEKPVKAAMSNSFGFGGTNACLIFTAA
ncbi:MAG: beta-ketoacyl-ACP synthase II [Pseudomonadota bacterium]